MGFGCIQCQRLLPTMGLLCLVTFPLAGGMSSVRLPLLDQPNLSFSRKTPMTSILKQREESRVPKPMSSSQDQALLNKDSCHTLKLQQTIREPDCRPKHVMNSFCFGHCSSFFVPQDSWDAQPPRPAVISCTACVPKRVRTHIVTLRCPNRKGAKHVRRRVLRVKQCACVPFKPELNLVPGGNPPITERHAKNQQATEQHITHTGDFSDFRIKLPLN